VEQVEFFASDRCLCRRPTTDVAVDAEALGVARWVEIVARCVLHVARVTRAARFGSTDALFWGFDVFKLADELKGRITRCQHIAELAVLTAAHGTARELVLQLDHPIANRAVLGAQHFIPILGKALNRHVGAFDLFTQFAIACLDHLCEQKYAQ